jgi:preprotein translocase subunit SecD
MNRFPIWKNALVVLALIVSFVYTLPNFFGEVPAVQVSSVKGTVRVDAVLRDRVVDVLAQVGIAHTGVYADENSIRVRVQDTDIQLKAKDAIDKALNPDPSDAVYSVALNLLSASPRWLTSLHALPMYLGLDLRGGVHFLLQVDMRGAITKRMDSFAAELRGVMRDKGVRHSGIGRIGQTVVMKFNDSPTRDKARDMILDTQPAMLEGSARTSVGTAPEYIVTENAVLPGASEFLLTIGFTETALRQVREGAIKQNIGTLHKRINELGVAEPVIQQQGADRIVVQLPGVQDVAQAKDLIGRTATLEVRMADLAPVGDTAPPGYELVPERRRDGSVTQVAVKRQVALTGDHFVGAQATFDEHQRPAVAVQLDGPGGRIMKEITREFLHKPMAIVLIEKGRPEAISVATIQGEFSNRFQITGNFSTEETNTLAILIRSGAIAAPMEFIEERVIGPSLGADNISKGFKSTQWGFVAIMIFMSVYYLLFGLVSVLALSANLLFLIALLSLLQATLTLPGIAAIALTLGMAIDANVLINERVREELRNGCAPHTAITAGYERAWGTILDSNITTLIAGIALLLFGSGPVRGFAVVHCLGILTSIFSSVVVSRALINLIYGGRRRLESVSIGQIWRPKH